MAIRGYIVISDTVEESFRQDFEWMTEFGCKISTDHLIDENSEQHELRKLIFDLRVRDTLVVQSLAVLTPSLSKLGFYIDYFIDNDIRLISLHDKIDTGDILFPETKTSDIFKTLARLRRDNRAINNKVILARSKSVKNIPPGICKPKDIRNELIVTMYKAGAPVKEIMAHTKLASEASVFKILRRLGVPLTRSAKSRKDPEETE